MIVVPDWVNMTDSEVAVECADGVPAALIEWARRYPDAGETKALVRDADGDGLIYDGTPRQRPAPVRGAGRAPRLTMRVVQPHEPAIAAGAARVAKYRTEAREYDGPGLSGDWEAVRDALTRTFDVEFQTTSGRTVHVDSLNVDVLGEDDSDRIYQVVGDLYDGVDYLGSFQRNITVTDGVPTAYHESLRLNPEAQGDGIAAEFNAHALAWYQQIGVEEIRVLASGTLHQQVFHENPLPTDRLPTLDEVIAYTADLASNGGYTWGQQGFDFVAPSAFRSTMLGRTTFAAEDPAVIESLRNYDSLTDAEQRGVQFMLDPDHNLASALPDDWWDDAVQRSILADFLEAVDPDRPPTPYELNGIGRGEPFLDVDTGQPTWLGKALMSRSSWPGRFDLSWLDAYPEAKALAHDDAFVLAGLFLASLGMDTDGFEAKAPRLSRGPRDADGDGFIYDGTPRQRVAPRLMPMRHDPAGVGTVMAAERETEERRRRQAAAARRRGTIATPPKPDVDTPPLGPGEYDMVRPSDPWPFENTGGAAAIEASTLSRSIANRIADRGGDPGITDVLIQRAASYDKAVRDGDRSRIGEALGRLLEVLAAIAGLRKPNGEPMLETEELGTAYSRLTEMHVVTNVDDAVAIADARAAAAAVRVDVRGDRGRPDGTGEKNDPIDVAGDLDRAAALIAEGKHVRLNRVDEVGTLVERLADLVREAEARGETAPTYDLCRVSVPGTNLFCSRSKGIPRLKMPQLSGKPEPGSLSDALPRNPRGNVNVKDLFLQALMDAGIAVTERVTSPSTLKASQSQLDGPAVGRIYTETKAGRPPGSGTLVTRDGYILDGHHQWAAQVALDSDNGTLGDVLMPIRVLDLDIAEALALALKFSKDYGIKPAGIGAADTARGPRG